MASINFYLRYFAIFLFVSKLSYGYQSLQRVTERLDVVEGELKEISQDLKEALRRESRYRREDIKAIYEVLKQLQGANASGSVADIRGHEEVNKCKSCTEEETSSKDNSLVLLLTAFKREKQINTHLRNELINIQNNLEEKMANLSEETVNNVAEEISTLLTFRNRLNDNVTVIVRSIEERLMSQLDQERTSIWTTISEVNADLSAINDSFIDEIGRCFEYLSNQTTTLNNLSSKVIHTPTSCDQVMSNKGQVHDINLKEINQTIPVFCDVDIDGGRWIVFQRRKYGSEDFDRAWEDYKLGFGDLKNDFWWGNEKLHLMTRGKSRELRIDLEDFDGNKAFAKYSSFRILSEEHNYKLEVDGYSGSAGDALNYDSYIHNGQEFSTRDRDNDEWERNCAATYQGGWWFSACFRANLNGNYFEKRQTKDSWQGILWYPFSIKSSLKFAEMKFR
ncbi:angiopoietin-related protein 7-like [Mya arenaria]|uniref:angiopoietin-related protein 7-like n=1 Tax=Mya arenaria TaxID=6604 RepID=UPI0022DE9F4D|nr:angiopoietin-related protein 7-like [Mya arenaria]